MSKKLKITLGSIYLTILIIFLYLLFSQFDISRINDFSYYKLLQASIEDFVGNNLALNLFNYFVRFFIFYFLKIRYLAN
jgi:hypothetical protein